MSREQRIHPRTAMREEIIYFSKHQSGYETDRIHYSGTLINISKGGVGMKVNLPHHINEELWFEGIEGINRAQPGTVKWLRAENDQESFEMGIQFF